MKIRITVKTVYVLDTDEMESTPVTVAQLRKDARNYGSLMIDLIHSEPACMNVSQRFSASAVKGDQQ
jgi:hypothetical protein